MASNPDASVIRVAARSGLYPAEQTIADRLKRAVYLADRVSDHNAFRPLEIEGGPDQVRGIEQPLGESYQFPGRQPAKAFVDRLGERERDARSR